MFKDRQDRENSRHRLLLKRSSVNAVFSCCGHSVLKLGIGLSGRHEFVADTMYRRDERRLAQSLDLLSYAVDANINSRCRGLAISAPNALQQLLRENTWFGCFRKNSNTAYSFGFRCQDSPLSARITWRSLVSTRSIGRDAKHQYRVATARSCCYCGFRPDGSSRY